MYIYFANLVFFKHTLLIKMKNVNYNFYFLNLFFYSWMLARLLPSLYTRLRYNKRALMLMQFYITVCASKLSAIVEGTCYTVYIGCAKRYLVCTLSPVTRYIRSVSCHGTRRPPLFCLSSHPIPRAPRTVTLGRAFGPFMKFSAASVVIEVSGRDKDEVGYLVSHGER